MATYEQLDSSYEVPDLSMGAILEHAIAARQMLEHVWDETTAHHSVVPWQPDDLISRGQCGVSSVWFARYLSGVGYSALVAEGTAVLGGSREEEFVWVEVQVEPNLLVADLTSDQFRTMFGTSAHVGAYTDGCPVVFRPEYRFDPYDVPRRKLMKRYDDMEERINLLPFWRKRGLTKPLPGRGL